jgi:hypothetical protein
MINLYSAKIKTKWRLQQFGIAAWLCLYGNVLLTRGWQNIRLDSCYNDKQSD